MTTATTPTLRWGIAATGGIAARMVDALRTLPDAEVVAVGSRAQSSADRFAAEHAIARAHGSYDDLFADDGVDIVYVASPHSHHHDMTVAALDAGRHVLC
jgi:predicted dehydrogenase